MTFDKTVRPSRASDWTFDKRQEDAVRTEKMFNNCKTDESNKIVTIEIPTSADVGHISRDITPATDRLERQSSLQLSVSERRHSGFAACWLLAAAQFSSRPGPHNSRRQQLEECVLKCVVAIEPCLRLHHRPSRSPNPLYIKVRLIHQPARNIDKLSTFRTASFRIICIRPQPLTTTVTHCISNL